MGDHGSDGVEAGGVRQPEVDEHAVRTLVQLRESLRQIAAPDEVISAARQLEELADQEGVTRVVLDEDDPEGGNRRHARGSPAPVTSSEALGEPSRWGSMKSVNRAGLRTSDVGSVGVIGARSRRHGRTIQ